MQCVLVAGDLHAAGITEFRSDQAQAYYALLLRSPEQAVVGLSSHEYKRRLAIASGVAPTLLALDASAANRAPAAAAILDAPPAGPLAAVSDDMPLLGLLDRPPGSPSSSIDGGDGAEAVEPAAPAGVDEHADGIDGDGGAAEFDIPDRIFGQRVALETHRKRDGTVRDQGLRIVCNNVGHLSCKAFRSIRVQRNIFGPRAAEFYLGCWLSLSGCDAEHHKRLKPSVAQIHEYIAQYT